jgi:hypothetical protein
MGVEPGKEDEVSEQDVEAIVKQAQAWAKLEGHQG